MHSTSPEATGGHTIPTDQRQAHAGRLVNSSDWLRRAVGKREV